MAKSTTNKKAAARKSSNTLKPTGKPSYGVTDPRLRASAASTPGNQNVGSTNPSYATPAPMGAVTPIAAPPVVTDPFLTPTDLANQALDLASVDQYLGNVDLQTANARTAAAQSLGDIDTAQGRNLDSADWNTASRGLAASSIRDTTKANISADAQRARDATQGNLKNATDYAASEHARADTVVKPAIGSKYDQLAKQNAEAATDARGGGAQDTGSGPQPTGAAPRAAAPQAVAPGAATQQQQASSGGGYDNVVKDGKFYHVYTNPDGSKRYVYIRPAGGATLTPTGGVTHG